MTLLVTWFAVFGTRLFYIQISLIIYLEKNKIKCTWCGLKKYWNSKFVVYLSLQDGIYSQNMDNECLKSSCQCYSQWRRKLENFEGYGNEKFGTAGYPLENSSVLAHFLLPLDNIAIFLYFSFLYYFSLLLFFLLGIFFLGGGVPLIEHFRGKRPPSASAACGGLQRNQRNNYWRILYLPADTKSPTVLCPNNVEQTVPADITGRKIYWEEPFVTDLSTRSGEEITTTLQSHLSGSFLPIGSTTVQYAFSDWADNTVSCEFQINLMQGIYILFEGTFIRRFDSCLSLVNFV